MLPTQKYQHIFKILIKNANFKILLNIDFKVIVTEKVKITVDIDSKADHIIWCGCRFGLYQFGDRISKTTKKQYIQVL